ncbi:U3 snoRNP protein [Entophlyctis sp. JEL0112]|nr:U3 snoRNP protein [Entophlyctis sp. JEL0112]
MAEQVRFHLEKMVPELEDLEARGVFSGPEIKEIVKRRTTLEYSIHRRISRRVDYLKYIEYEMNLERLRKKRKLRLGLDMKQPAKNDKKDQTESDEVPGQKHLGFTLSDYSINQRINQLYQKALKRFPGDVDLWIQYFSWAKGLGASNVLGRSFARAIQLHPLNPTMYILAAQYEFQDNSNITSARVLMQRGIRLNKESTVLWHEYFKLELLWIEKIKQRRRILFGIQSAEENVTDALEEKKRKLEFADENDNEDEGDTGVHLEEENSETVEAGPDLVPVDGSDDSTLSIQKSLSSTQKGVLDMAIPKAVYRNAIQTIPKDLDFRIGFLKLYQKFGMDTLGAQTEIFDSIKADFPRNPIAVGVIAERHITDLDVSDVAYPSALKRVVDEYEEAVKEHQDPEMWAKYTSFLTETLSKVTESNLQRFLFVILQKAYNAADAKKQSSAQLYLSWSELNNHNSEAKMSLLDKGLASFPRSSVLWCAKLRLVLALDSTTPELLEKTVGRALALVGKPVDELSIPTREEKADRFAVWKLYLEYLSTVPQSGETASPRRSLDLVEKRFCECLSVQELGKRVRKSAERLMSFKQRSATFFRKCLNFEEQAILGESGDNYTGGVVAVAKKRLGSAPLDSSQVAKLRKWHELICFADPARIDSWIAFLSFEMHVTKDIKRVTELVWRAKKEVADVDEFTLRYESLRNE